MGIVKDRWSVPIYTVIKIHSLDSNPNILALNPMISSLKALVVSSNPYIGVLVIFYQNTSLCFFKNFEINCIIAYVLTFPNLSMSYDDFLKTMTMKDTFLL